MKEEEKKEKRFISLLSDTTFKHLIKIEDYIEFFSEELPNDQFIQERFLNFYKRVINIIFSYSDLKRNNLIKDLQNWILKIFPDDYIYKEDRSNNE